LLSNFSIMAHFSIMGQWYRGWLACVQDKYIEAFI